MPKQHSMCWSPTAWEFTSARMKPSSQQIGPLVGLVKERTGGADGAGLREKAACWSVCFFGPALTAAQFFGRGLLTVGVEGLFTRSNAQNDEIDVDGTKNTFNGRQVRSIARSTRDEHLH